jgi:hypothetical protein
MGDIRKDIDFLVEIADSGLSNLALETAGNIHDYFESAEQRLALADALAEAVRACKEDAEMEGWATMSVDNYDRLTDALKAYREGE